MPPKGYVNVSTTLKIKDAEILRERITQLGFSSLHSFLKAIVRDERPDFTSMFTSKTELEKPKNGLTLPRIWWAGRDLNSRPSACQASS